VLAGACATNAGDGRNDAFLSNGKADGSIEDGSPEALGVLAVANTLTRDQFENDVGLDSQAATGIVGHRDGADQVAGTADDDPFDTLEELDDVPYVGKIAFGKLLAYAQTHGYVHADTTWHFENPLPDDRQRTAVFSMAEDDVWAVGAAGLVEHWDGSTWHDVASGYTGTLTGVWAAGANDVWVVGQGGTILHWDGSSFTNLDAHTTRDLFAVHGSGANDVWIVGDNDANAFYGLVLHWDGSSFKVLSPTDCPNTLYTVYANSPTDVWVGGAVRTVCHFNGAQWEYASLPGPNQGTVTDLHPSSTGIIWGVYDGEIWRRDGSTWTFSYRLPAVEAVSATMLSRLSPVADDDLWASGSHGFVVHWDGTAWTPTRIPGNASYVAVAAKGLSAWAVGPAARAQFTAGDWAESYHVVTRQWLWSTAGTSPMNLWALGSTGDLLHRTVDGWSSVAMPLTESDHPKALYAGADDDLWVVGFSKAAHWDGAAFTLHPELTNIYGVGGTSSSDVWAVGDGGKAMHYDGATWTTANTGVHNVLYGVAASGPQDVWVAGTGTILHYDGTTWTRVNDAHDTTSWTTVIANAPDDVWISGQSPTVMHWDGSAWTMLTATTSTRPWLRAAWAAGHDDSWFVESNNALLHWDGTAFARTAMPGVGTVLGFAGSGLWATGDGGFIQRRAL
jgi:hypothetical protein